MKKITAFILAAAISVLGAAAVSARDISVYLDNQKTYLKDANGSVVEPFIQNGTTYVPLRGVSELLGCDVEWDGSNKTIKIYENSSHNYETFRNWGNDIKVYFNSEEIEFKNANGATVKPFIEDGTTYVPLRGISETLGCQVDWDSSEFAVRIWDKAVPPEGTPLYYLQPSESYEVSFYYDINGKQLEMDGKYYSNAMCPNWSGTYAIFDLNGKYEYMTFDAGLLDSVNSDKKITFIVDGKIVDICEIPVNASTKSFRVELNHGLSLKILFESGTFYEYTGMGNVVFH